MIASAALCPLSKYPFNTGTIASTPLQIRSIGSCFPITPVDATSTLTSEDAVKNAKETIYDEVKVPKVVGGES